MRFLAEPSRRPGQIMRAAVLKAGFDELRIIESEIRQVALDYCLQHWEPTPEWTGYKRHETQTW